MRISPNGLHWIMLQSKWSLLLYDRGGDLFHNAVWCRQTVPSIAEHVNDFDSKG